MRKSGIYRIVNAVNGRVYVGSAINLKSRKEDHWKTLRANRHSNMFLQRAWNKYGESQFSFVVIENVDDKSLLLEREQFYLDQLSFEKGDPNRCYNICRVAGSLLGTKRTAEHRAKISAATKGRVISPEHRAKQSAAMKGRVRTPEHQAKLADARRGKKMSAEFCRRNGDLKRGTKHSLETKAKMSEALKGRTPSEAHKLALRESNRSFTQEQVDDMVRRRKAGETYPDIAKVYGTTKDTVRNWCLKEGLNKVNVYTSDDQRMEIFRRRESGESLASIAKDLGVSEATVVRKHRDMKAKQDQLPPRIHKESPGTQFSLL